MNNTKYEIKECVLRAILDLEKARELAETSKFCKSASQRLKNHCQGLLTDFIFPSKFLDDIEAESIKLARKGN